MMAKGAMSRFYIKYTTISSSCCFFLFLIQVNGNRMSTFTTSKIVYGQCGLLTLCLKSSTEDHKKIIFHFILFVASYSCLISILDFCTVQSWNGKKVRNLLHVPRWYAGHKFHVKTFKQCYASCSTLLLFNFKCNTYTLKLAFIIFMQTTNWMFIEHHSI